MDVCTGATTDAELDEMVRRRVEALTITGLLHRNATRLGHRPALTTGIDPGASTLSWAELRSEVAALTHGLGALGLGGGDRFLIMMAKRPEHWIIDLAAVHHGAITCTAYDTLSTEEIRFVAEHSGAEIVVLEGAEQLDKWRPILDELPALRKVIVVDADAIPTGDDRFVSYDLLRRKGFDAQAEFAGEFDRLAEEVDPDQPLCMIYTSGTTGDPKGVVLSHRNVLHESIMQDELVPVPDNPRTVSYLPLAHVAERVLGIYLPLTNCGHVTICADQTRLMATLAAVRPHGFFGVPRVWEKIAAGLEARIATMPAAQRAAVTEATEVSRAVFRLRAAGEAVPEELADRERTADEQVLAPIRAMLGLDRSTRNFSGAAPIPVAVLEFLAGFGLNVMEVWGLSETTGCATVSTPRRFAPGTVGSAAPGMRLRLAADGEIFVRGPVVFLGYLRADGTVVPATDAEGWFATGDIGALDDRGLLRITDRKKDILITSGGKNVAPAAVEGPLRGHPLIGHAVVVGDRRPYLSALLVLDPETARDWARHNGLGELSEAELAGHPAVRSELDHVVATVNARLARAEQVKRYRILPGPWTPETGELTPTLKIRRRVVTDAHAGDIDALYAVHD